MTDKSNIANQIEKKWSEKERKKSKQYGETQIYWFCYKLKLENKHTSKD